MSKMGAKRFVTTVRAPIVGGNWVDGSYAGLAALNLNNHPSNRNSNIGCRSALNHEGQKFQRHGVGSSAELNGLCIPSLGLEYGWALFASSSVECKQGHYA